LIKLYWIIKEIPFFLIFENKVYRKSLIDCGKLIIDAFFC
jgi:hypothetical protein